MAYRNAPYTRAVVSMSSVAIQPLDEDHSTEQEIAMSPTNTENLKDHLGEASSHLKTAASAAGVAIKGAAGAASDELRIGKASVRAELSDTALSGLAAAESGGAAAKEQVDALMDKGKDLIDSAAELIRERPLASFGVAFAAGWIIAKLGRSGNGE